MPAPRHARSRRLRHLATLAQRHWIDPCADTPASVDLHSYLTGRAPCCRFAVVSFSPDISGTPAIYVNADLDSFFKATEAAVSLIGGSAPIEVPLEIVNLDTGETWKPDFSQAPWEIVAISSNPKTEADLMKADRLGTDYQPLDGVTADRFSALYPIHEEIRNHGFRSATLDMVVHSEADFARAFNKIAKRYSAGVPIDGARMRKIVAQAAELAASREPDRS